MIIVIKMGIKMTILMIIVIKMTILMIIVIKMVIHLEKGDKTGDKEDGGDDIT